jgi:hypothetical protein
MWRIWRALNNASKWQTGFNLAFKGLICNKRNTTLEILCVNTRGFLIKYTILFQEILLLILKTMDSKSSGCVRKFLLACVREM